MTFYRFTGGDYTHRFRVLYNSYELVFEKVGPVTFVVFVIFPYCDESNRATRSLSVSPLAPIGLTISRTVHVSEADQNRS